MSVHSNILGGCKFSEWVQNYVKMWIAHGPATNASVQLSSVIWYIYNSEFHSKVPLQSPQKYTKLYKADLMSRVFTHLLRAYPPFS